MIQRLIMACASILVSLAAFAAELPRDVVLVETSSSQYRFEVEIADDATERSEGLMGRAYLADNAGMLFLYPETRPVEFWMKNTPLSLDILFITTDGRVHHIAENTKPLSTDTIPSNGVVYGVIELKAGSAARMKIRPGAQVIHPAFRQN